MPRPRFSHSTFSIRLGCFIICYSLVSPFFAIIPGTSIVVASTVIPIGPSKKKTNTPRKTTQAAQKARWRDGELLVHFRQGISQADIDALLQANGAQRMGRLPGQSGVERLRLPAGSDPEALAAAMRSSQRVDFAEPNYVITADQIIPNDPRFSEQWALQNAGTSEGHFGSDISAAQGWQTTTGSKRTVIAVIDSGVDFTHLDLRNNEWNNLLEQANSLDDENNGFADDLHGWDFVTKTNEIRDEQGHGTAVAGIIAARGNNSTGISGVMWRASLMSLRVLDNAGMGDVANLLSIRYTGYNWSYGTMQGIQGDVLRLNRDYDTGARVEKCMFGNVGY